MLRKLNFTERATIPRSAIRIVLRRENDGILAFDPAIDVSRIAAPLESRVYIEAQYRTSYMRFDCGTLAAISIPGERRLDEIDSDRVVRFRVKVVDNSTSDRRIVAASNDITVACESGGSASRVSLLPVNFTDLGDQVWRLHFEAGLPVLELNNRIDSIERMARDDAEFFALVYPAAVREILTNILLVDRWEPDADGDEWSDLWIRWALELAGESLPDDIDERREWIDQTIAAFCGRHSIVQKMQSRAEESA